MKPLKPTSLADMLKEFKKVEKGLAYDYESGPEATFNAIKKRPPGEYIYKQAAAEMEADHKASIAKMVAEMAAAEAAKQAAMVESENKKWQALIDDIIDAGLYEPLETIDLVTRLRERGKDIETARNVFDLAIEGARRDKLERERKEAAAKIPKPSAYGSWA